MAELSTGRICPRCRHYHNAHHEIRDDKQGPVERVFCNHKVPDWGACGCPECWCMSCRLQYDRRPQYLLIGNGLRTGVPA